MDKRIQYLVHCIIQLYTSIVFCFATLGEKLADRSTHLQIKQRKLLKHRQILVLCSQSKLVRVLVFRVPEGRQSGSLKEGFSCVTQRR